MNQRVFLLCDIVKQEGNRFMLRSELRDGSTFEVMAPRAEVRTINRQSAWLVVESSGERDGVVSITLPEPILSMGRMISVPIERISKVGVVPKPAKPKLDNSKSAKKKQIKKKT
jgi:hypothetical protein